MNLIVDIGNTRTKIALFNAGELMFNLSVDELMPENVRMLQEEHPTLNKAILSATRPYPESLKDHLLHNFEQFIELDHNTPVPIENCYETKETLGKDRLAAAVGANDLFPGKNILIADAGTAITFDLVNSHGQFLGGNISPGLEMRYKALHHFTGKLPLVEVKDDYPPIGKNTIDAIRAGVQNGILFETEKYIEQLQKKFDDLVIIITGGDANFFGKRLKNPIFVYYNLTVIGLNRILEFNSKQ